VEGDKRFGRFAPEEITHQRRNLEANQTGEKRFELVERSPLESRRGWRE
jgi:hypothetical protein